MAKSLFERLPVPQKNARHEDGVMSLTAALKGNTTSSRGIGTQPLIKVTKKNPAVIAAQPQPTDEDDADEVESRQKVASVVEVSADDLVNRDEFYRRQLQNHSVSMFHRQIVTRTQNDSAAQAQEQLASRGKKRNQLASMAQAHMDVVSQASLSMASQSDKDNNRDQFRLKKQRYGW